jgi:phospholipid transport system substrate-binding protein
MNLSRSSNAASYTKSNRAELVRLLREAIDAEPHELWLNCDSGNDSCRPAFSRTAGRTHESKMKRLASRLSALVCAFTLCAVVLPHIAAAATASDTVRSFYQTLQSNMQNGPSLGQQGRVARLTPIVPRVFDISYMTQLAVGPAWATLPDPQRQQVMQAFERYVTAVYAERFDKYSGERLEVIGEQPTAYGTTVKTQIVKADGEPVTLNYLMVNGAGGPQIGDVYLNGTISELAARRADFSSTLRTQGVPGLIAKLNNKALTLAPTLSGSSSRP